MDARRIIMELPFLSQNMQAYIVRSRVPDVPRFQSLVSRSAEVSVSLLDFSRFALVWHGDGQQGSLCTTSQRAWSGIVL